ncbi:hypothetical protein LZ683_08815 [Comamonas testosteroni]|uniref:hypothetical protein n=1 Tax=Comamonas testosteroni TaxID=285 RepID=UPI0023AB241A|nr:hypothetical protein [Comamonas testosteroni]WEE79442.1 hypothetical protein LZ683_08815 [Comamonas testosteroni]
MIDFASFFKAWVLLVFWLPQLLITLHRNWFGHFNIFRDSPDDFLTFLAWLGSTRVNRGDDMERYFLRASDERQRRAIVKRSRT